MTETPETRRKRGPVRRFFGALWRAVDAGRRFTFNLLFVVLVIALLVFLLGDGGPEIPDPGALVLAPEGDVVEQLAGDPLDRAFDELAGNADPQTLLRDLVDPVVAATDDERIQVLVLDLESMAGAGLASLEELAAAVEGFKAAGKKVVATAENYSQAAYYLAAHADEIHMDEMGMVLLSGYGRYRTYYKDGLDRLGVDVHVFRVGEYKSAVEPFLRDDMSEEAKEANLEWLGDLWGSWLDAVSRARGMERAQLESAVDRFLEVLEQEEGHTARTARRLGLVDHLGDRDSFRRRMQKLLDPEGEGEDQIAEGPRGDGTPDGDATRDRDGEQTGDGTQDDDEEDSYPQVHSDVYLASLEERPSAPEGDERVAVIVAKGSIVDGTSPPGEIGGDSTARLIRRARLDDEVGALVLRVDSGGGSAFASEVIRRELALARQDGKPVVVSMGNVAASGGYWISTASDEIWASPSTITGSIGIFGLFPTFQKPLREYLGMRVDGVGTTPLAGALRPDRDLPEEAARAIHLIIDQGYRDFLQRVADNRDMTVEEVDRIARGRVWSGADAYELGLVDHLGGIDGAIAAAAGLAGLEEGWGVDWVEPERSFRERLMADLLAGAAAITAPVQGSPGALEALARGPLGDRFGAFLRRQAETVAAFNDPRGVYAHCLCEVR